MNTASKAIIQHSTALPVLWLIIVFLGWKVLVLLRVRPPELWLDLQAAQHGGILMFGKHAIQQPECRDHRTHISYACWPFVPGLPTDPTTLNLLPIVLME